MQFHCPVMLKLVMVRRSFRQRHCRIDFETAFVRTCYKRGLFCCFYRQPQHATTLFRSRPMSAPPDKPPHTSEEKYTKGGQMLWMKKSRTCPTKLPNCWNSAISGKSSRSLTTKCLRTPLNCWKSCPKRKCRWFFDYLPSKMPQTRSSK